MARKATAKQKATAKKLGIRVTKTVGGKRKEVDAETLKKRIAKEKEKRANKKAAAKRKAQSKKIVGSPKSKAADKRIKSSTEAGQRRAKKYSKIKYKKRNPKTGKMEWVTVRRKNATSRDGKYITPTSGRKYTERRANRTDKGKTI